MRNEKKKMPRYYFDVDDGNGLNTDNDGVECASLDDLKFAAVDALPDLARDELPNGDRVRFSVKVRDLSGKYLLEASLTLNVEWAAGSS